MPHWIDSGSAEDIVGAGTFARGAKYAQRGAVLEYFWDTDRRSLHGFVRGSDYEPYRTKVYLTAVPAGRLAFKYGECSCPVGFNCKHAVALMLTATGDADPGLAQSDDLALAAEPAPPAWEQSLTGLLTGPGHPAAGRPSIGLGIELTLARTAHTFYLADADQHPRPQLWARLVQRGRNGGWVAGNLGWARLDQLRHQGEHHGDQVRLLSEIYGLYRSGQGMTAYYSYGSSYGSDKTIDLAAFDSRQLWPLLDEARSIGLPLIYPGRGSELPPWQRAAFCLDITCPQADGPVLVTPRLTIEETGEQAQVLGFIGASGHGVIWAQDLAGPFQLARLGQPVPDQLQRMATAGDQLEIPADQQGRFRDGYYLRLRQLTPLISSDESFEPPRISGPTLVVHADYPGGHAVDVSCEWTYQIGDSLLRVGLLPGPGDPVFRDFGAEQSILSGIDSHLDRFGLLPDAHFDLPAPPRRRITGLDTMRLTTELLPLLRETPGVSVEVTGAPADYREVGDSLSIGVSVDQVTGDNDWFDLGITISVAGREIPFIDVFSALARRQTYLLLDDGGYFSLDKPELRHLARLIEEARALQEASPLGSLKISRYQADLWQELTELGVISRQAQTWQRQVDGLLSATLGEPEPLPPTINAQLRPYQAEGFTWLAFLYQHKLGGILADDMGLGKTLQCLSLLAHARAADPAAPPFLIVAPTSVVPNWATECARFAPDLRVVTLTETSARRGQPLDQVVAGADAVVTSYTLLRIDFEDYSKLSWSGLTLDEAQNAKNHQSKIYQCVRRLPAPFKLAITGTPMENNLMELWSLLSITAPGLFPHPQRFRDYYARPIENRGKDHAELLTQLRRRIRPLVLRRTKEQVAVDLPAKQEQVLEIDLHPKHRKLYQTQLQRERQKVLRLIDDLDENRFTILRSLTLLRQLSLHAGLIDDEHHTVPSAKIDTLVEQLSDIARSGHRALVFSQFTGFLGKVRQRLDAEQIAYCYLDGSTRNRAAVLAEFKEGSAPVFLISLKAGGFGLNLTEADYCFLLDPWWNPATEAQAIDRTHRIGQTRKVMVYRLIAADTIEQKVMALAARKAELFTSVLDEGSAFSSSISADDLRELFA